MDQSGPQQPVPVRRRALVWATGAALLSLAAFVAGRATVAPVREPERGARAGAAAEASGGPGAGTGSAVAAVAPADRVTEAAPPTDAAATADPRAVILTPDQVAHLQIALSAGLEDRRAELVARCMPDEGLPGGKTSTALVFNVTFDPQGREIARGIIDDRRAPAGAFLDCLARRPDGALSIPPPGKHVTLRATVRFP
jgi:hypothetical protein